MWNIIDVKCVRQGNEAISLLFIHEYIFTCGLRVAPVGCRGRIELRIQVCI